MQSKTILEIFDKLGIELDDLSKEIICIVEKKVTINENTLAEQLDLRINDVRKVLYKLADLGFATYVKEKDEEKKWWYVYIWHLEKSKIHYRYISYIRNQLHEKERQLLEEQQYMFECKRCGRKYKYREALEFNFMCDSCDGIVKEVKNKKLIRELSVSIKEFLEEIHKEEEIARKNREAEVKAIETLDKEIAEKAAAVKERAKKKAARALAKANPKKKVTKPRKSKDLLGLAERSSARKKPVKKAAKKITKKKPTQNKPLKKVTKKKSTKIVKKATRKPIKTVKRVITKPIKKVTKKKITKKKLR
jgi:transcription initiation factor TFIIE subunit alpha